MKFDDILETENSKTTVIKPKKISKKKQVLFCIFILYIGVSTIYTTTNILLFIFNL